MTYRLLVKKLGMEKNKLIVRNVLEKYVKLLKMDYNSVVRYLISNDYLVRVFRGIYYIKSLDERKLKKTDTNYLDVIKEALLLKGVDNWYFGLDSALKLNAMTHEYFSVDYIISDKIFRLKPFKIFGHKIKFMKVKESLMDFGIVKKNINYSDKEKTILDIIYFEKYNGKSENEILGRISSYIEEVNKKKIYGYLKYYPKSVKKIIEEII